MNIFGNLFGNASIQKMAFKKITEMMQQENIVALVVMPPLPGEDQPQVTMATKPGEWVDAETLEYYKNCVQKLIEHESNAG